MTGRLALGALGVSAMGIGLAVMVTDPYIRDPLDVARWLAGAVLLHDGVLVPLVLAVGAALRLLPVRGPLRCGLIVAGCLTAIALPMMLAPAVPANPSVRPLDYPRNWLVALAAVAVGTAAATGVTLRLRSHREAPASGERPHLGDPPVGDGEDVDAALDYGLPRSVGDADRPPRGDLSAAGVDGRDAVDGVTQAGGRVGGAVPADERGELVGPAQGVGAGGTAPGSAEADPEVRDEKPRGEG